MNDVYIRKEYLSKWIAKYFKNDLISIDDMLNVIENLDGEIDSWRIKYEELKNDMLDNYIPVSYAKQYEISDREFYE